MDVGDSRLAVILESAREGLSGLPVDVSEMIVVRVVPSMTTVVVNKAQFGGVRIPDAAEPDKIEVTVVLLIEVVSDANTSVVGEEGEAKDDDRTVVVELPDGGGQRVEIEAELSRLWFVVVMLESRSILVLGSGFGLDTSPEVVGVAAEERHALLLTEIAHVVESERSVLVLDVRSAIGADRVVLGVAENVQSEGVLVSRPFVGVLVLREVFVWLSSDDSLSKGSGFEVKLT
ncbi:unnamed protein product [Clonostachys rhizophaga]|uniref:Uncharacterized protein n=1 Tax=Clonostachys rhizophaga TaxID=160324 RepID=A0A9N9V4Y0_9HYPO|nr:unnamed protein product [Clonostachys rhizophaga]